DRHLADERPLARPDVDEPEALERPQRFPHGRAADDELLGELALGRYPVAALEASFGDQLLDLPNDLLVDPRRLDRSKLDGVIAWGPAAGRAHRRLRDSPARGRAGGSARATIRAPSPPRRCRWAPRSAVPRHHLRTSAEGLDPRSASRRRRTRAGPRQARRSRCSGSSAAPGARRPR